MRPDIVVTSGVAARNGEGFVVIHWGDQTGQLTPEEARQHALGIIQAADAAEFDAAIFKAFPTDARGATENAVAIGLLKLIREARGEPPTQSGREKT